MSATVSSSSGDTKDTFKMEQIQSPDENVYEKITEQEDNDGTYVNLKRERKNDVDISERYKLNTRKLIIVVLCSVMVCVIVSVGSSTAIVYAVFKGSGTDGGWTSWGDWGVCSVTCGGGLITRSRTCSSPQPSSMGKYCDGTSEQVKICNTYPCSVLGTDGGWTSWGDWGACSVTCGGGLITRSRTCSSPQPSSMGKYCGGTSEQVKICNNYPCAGSGIGFSVYNPNKTSAGNPLIFETVLYNSDDVFNMTSGTFVCTQEGLYLFINTIMRLRNRSGAVYCRFYKNGVKHQYVAGYADSADTSVNPSGTNSILYHLKAGDRVYLGSCSDISDIDHSSSFTGILIRPFY